ncbi:hypothetical protein LCGC14_0477760 [marine sediment metagenome]|uniref:Uncharacterized protein n=1 Tax=marine sediment metagenome TaxID=412755 RepID=A0A0F9SAD0_9ZZZZ
MVNKIKEKVLKDTSPLIEGLHNKNIDSSYFTYKDIKDVMKEAIDTTFAEVGKVIDTYRAVLIYDFDKFEDGEKVEKRFKELKIKLGIK